MKIVYLIYGLKMKMLYYMTENVASEGWKCGHKMKDSLSGSWCRTTTRSQTLFIPQPSYGSLDVKQQGYIFTDFPEKYIGLKYSIYQPIPVPEMENYPRCQFRCNPWRVIQADPWRVINPGKGENRYCNSLLQTELSREVLGQA